MTPEQHAQAKALIDLYKGKITEGQWLQVYGERWSCLGLEISFRDKPSISAKIEDIALMADAPTLLALLEVALNDNSVLLYLSQNVLEENAELKQRIAQLEEKHDKGA